MPSQVSKPDADNIAGQIWIAFGRGALGMPVDASAVDEMISTYRKSYKDIIDAWEDNAPGIMVFTEALADTAAKEARKDQSGVIQDTHVRYAIETISEVCPCGGPMMKTS